MKELCEKTDESHTNVKSPLKSSSLKLNVMSLDYCVMSLSFCFIRNLQILMLFSIVQRVQRILNNNRATRLRIALTGTIAVD